MKQNQSDNQKPADRSEEPELATASCSGPLLWAGPPMVTISNTIRFLDERGGTLDSHVIVAAMLDGDRIVSPILQSATLIPPGVEIPDLVNMALGILPNDQEQSMPDRKGK